jgi:DNA (cytosine-5)-methyltransferase 1
MRYDPYDPFWDVRRPRLLDLFCGAGGAAMGYYRAGFDVVGVDIKPQPHYPFPFVQADALTFPLDDFDLVHASPPCQVYSRTAKILEGKGLPNKHPDLVGPLQDRLRRALVPYVIENVPGSPLHKPVVLCGTQFGLRVYRHRLFEASVPLQAPSHQKHVLSTGSHRGYSKGYPMVTVGGPNYNLAEAQAAMGMTKMGRPPQLGTMLHVVGHFSDVEAGRAALGAPWMTRDELSQAIPPAYTEYIGRQLLAHLRGA